MRIALCELFCVHIHCSLSVSLTGYVYTWFMLNIRISSWKFIIICLLKLLLVVQHNLKMLRYSSMIKWIYECINCVKPNCFGTTSATFPVCYVPMSTRMYTCQWAREWIRANEHENVYVPMSTRMCTCQRARECIRASEHENEYVPKSTRINWCQMGTLYKSYQRYVWKPMFCLGHGSGYTERLTLRGMPYNNRMICILLGYWLGWSPKMYPN
jgi:hypothetical protein